jgi:hypothetical protein
MTATQTVTGGNSGMSEPMDHAAHLQGIKDSVEQRDRAAAELETAKAVEAKAREAREAKATTHRGAMDHYHSSLYEAWRAGVDVQLIMATSGISKSRLYAVIKKMETEG